MSGGQLLLMVKRGAGMHDRSTPFIDMRGVVLYRKKENYLSYCI